MRSISLAVALLAVRLAGQIQAIRPDDLVAKALGSQPSFSGCVNIERSVRWCTSTVQSVTASRSRKTALWAVLSRCLPSLQLLACGLQPLQINMRLGFRLNLV